MCKADRTIQVYNAIQRHTPKFEEIDFLLVHQCDLMLWIRNADEWQIVFAPIFLEGFQSIRPNGNDLNIAGCKVGMVLTQARQLRTAVWSHKSAQKIKQNDLFSTIA